MNMERIESKFGCKKKLAKCSHTDESRLLRASLTGNIFLEHFTEKMEASVDCNEFSVMFLFPYQCCRAPGWVAKPTAVKFSAHLSRCYENAMFPMSPAGCSDSLIRTGSSTAIAAKALFGRPYHMLGLHVVWGRVDSSLMSVIGVYSYFVPLTSTDQCVLHTALSLPYPPSILVPSGLRLAVSPDFLLCFTRTRS